jgi:AraC-like DNA-binding protein
VAVEMSTDDLPARERFGFWRELTGQMLAPVEVRSDHADDFLASARLVQLGNVQMSLVRCPSYTARRTARGIRQSDPELLQLSFNRQGRSGMAQAGREISLGHRELVLYDTSRPFRGWAQPTGEFAEGVLVALPRQALPAPLVRRATAVPAQFPTTKGIGALLARFIELAILHADELTPADATRLADVTVDLVGAVLSHHFEAPRALPPEAHRRVLLAGIHDFVERHLGDPQLSPTTIAATNHISVRYLHRLFQQQGMTVRDWIRERRLTHCRANLADPAQRGTTIQTIAARWGFVDPAHFSRVFRAAYGITPTEFRRSEQEKVR